MLVSLALVAIAIVTRIALRQHFGEPIGHEAAYLFTPSRMDALAIGALIAALVREPRCAAWMAARASGAFAVGGLGLLGVSLAVGHLQRTGAAMQSSGYALIAAAFGLLLCGALRPGVLAQGLSFEPLRRCGLYSYGMYVFYAPLHLFVGLPLLARIAGPAPDAPTALLYVVIAIALTFALAALSYHAYERRFLALKTQLAPVPAS